MCVDPATLSIGATVIGTGLSIMDRASKHTAAVSNRNDMLSSVLNETVPSINQSLAQGVYNSNAARTNQERDAATTQSFDILRGMAEAKSTATVAAAEAGVGGVSFANVLADFEMREGLAKANLDYNVTAKGQQIADESVAASKKAQAQINSAINAAVNATPVPSPTALWAGIGSDVVGAGLKIGDKLGVFDDKTKIDPATGTSFWKGAGLA